MTGESGSRLPRLSSRSGSARMGPSRSDQTNERSGPRYVRCSRCSRPALPGAGLDAACVELPAVGVRSALAAHASTVAGQEEAAELAQREGPGGVDGALLVEVGVGALWPIELVHGVVADVVAAAAGRVAGTVVSAHGVVPGVLLGGHGTDLQGGLVEPTRPLAGGHDLRHVAAEGHLLDVPGAGAQDADRPWRHGLAGPAGAGRARRGRRWCGQLRDGQEGRHGERGKADAQGDGFGPRTSAGSTARRAVMSRASGTSMRAARHRWGDDEGSAPHIGRVGGGVVATGVDDQVGSAREASAVNESRDIRRLGNAR